MLWPCNLTNLCLFKFSFQTFLICHSVGFGATIGWLFAFDREILELSLAMLILSVASIYVAVGISYKRVHDNLEHLDTKENKSGWP